MKQILTTILAGLALLSFAAADEEGFVSLFDGKSLDKWENPYNHGRVGVVDEEILLFGDKKFFLCTKHTDDKDAEGYIGLQHHGEKGQTYRFRYARIKVLK